MQRQHLWAALAGLVAVAAPAAAQHGVVLAPDGIEWAAAPAILPPGAGAAVLYGNPAEEGLFALRLRMPAGYYIAPHTHPKPEVVTVISGTFRLGMGQTAATEAAEPLAAGSFFALEPEMAHFAYADEATVIQLNSFGPWTLKYVDPADDPRGQPSN